AAPTVGAASGAAAQLAQLVLGLGLVIGLIFLLAWLVRRVQQAGPRGNRLIRTLASQPLGPRDRLVLVQVGEEQILLGLTPGRITPLHVLKEPVHLPDGEPATPEFAQRLLELLNKDPKGKP
ncbi:flagellar biosynthetic protein FliO, partial [Pseudomonas aeruginosa]